MSEQVVDALLELGGGLMERRPWCQRVLHSPSTGAICLKGGIRADRLRRAVPGGERRAEEYRLAAWEIEEALFRCLPAMNYSLPSWNDQPDRTKLGRLLDLIQTAAKAEMKKPRRGGKFLRDSPHHPGCRSGEVVCIPFRVVLSTSASPNPPAPLTFGWERGLGVLFRASGTFFLAD